MNNQINKLKKLIDESNNIVFFTGAGVSTESGLKDFRSKDGLYNEKNDYTYSPEFMLSKTFFYYDTHEFYRFYKDKMNTLKYKPNIVHKYISDLQNSKNIVVITQNIDGLHTLAGSNTVYELHGTVNKNYCLKCNKEYDAEYVFNSLDIPMCTCGGLIKPKVVLYEEALPEEEFRKSREAINNTDLLIVMGTSLTVYPASSLIEEYNKDNLIIINNDSTPFDYKAKIVMHNKLSDVIKELKNNE